MAARTAAPDAPIVVVDDDPKIVQLVRAYLEREGFAVLTAASGPEALELIRTRQPRLVVLDVMLPDLDGVAVTRLARAETDVPILMLSARGSVADRVRGINVGADDYLAKPFSPSELVARVKAVLRRTENEPGTGHKLQLGDLAIDLDRHEVRRGGDPILLSDLELRLLARLAQADGAVLTRDALLASLHGIDGDDVLDRSIDVYVGRLREKLGDDPHRPRYVVTVRGVGYRAAALEGRR